MKILFLTKRFYPEIGGVEKHVYEISKNLISRGHEVSLIAEAYPNKYHNSNDNYQSIAQSDTHGINNKQPVKSSQTAHFTMDEITIHRINVGREDWFKKFRIWREVLKKIKLFKDADVVHCHDVFFWYLPIRFLFPKKRVFTTFHGYESYPVKKKAIAIRRVSESLSCGTICVGEFMKKWYNAVPDKIIYGGVNIPKKFKKVKEPKAVFFGRLEKQTSIEGYVRASLLLKEGIPHFKLIVYGNGPLMRKLKINVQDFDSQIEEKLKDYKFVFVSRYLSILEALAAKKMIFALYDNPLKRDYLKMTPFKDFISISGSPKELASEVQYYYSNKKSEQQKIEAGFKWVKQQSWDNVASVYLSLWKK